MALGLLWALNILFAGITAGLLVMLLSVYGKNVKEVRSKFTVGLLAFAALFLAQNLLGMWAYLAMNDAGKGADVAFPMLVLNATETGALGTLVAISWE